MTKSLFFIIIPLSSILALMGFLNQTTTPGSLSSFYQSAAQSDGAALGEMAVENHESLDSAEFQQELKKMGVFLGLTDQTQLTEFVRVGTESAKKAEKALQ